MKVYIQPVHDRQESNEVTARIADFVSRGYELTNPDLETSLYKAEQADVIVARIDCYDDSSWAAMGVARAGQRPIVPFWGASWEYPDAFNEIPTRVYGFQKNVHLRNRHLMREPSSKYAWPSSDPKAIVGDLHVLEQNDGWRGQRVAKPEKETVDVEKPFYIVGDSRQWWDQLAFYAIEIAFKAQGISTINPSRILDRYVIADFPSLMVKDPDFNGEEECFQNAGSRSGGIVSRSIHVRNLMGCRFEEGIAWFEGHPILFLNSYVFPGRKDPQKKFDDGKNPGMHLRDVFQQNRDMWGIKKSVGRTVGDLTKVICELRGLEYAAPSRREIMEAFDGFNSGYSGYMFLPGRFIFELTRF